MAGDQPERVKTQSRVYGVFEKNAQLRREFRGDIIAQSFALFVICQQSQKQKM